MEHATVFDTKSGKIKTRYAASDKKLLEKQELPEGYSRITEETEEGDSIDPLTGKVVKGQVESPEDIISAFAVKLERTERILVSGSRGEVEDLIDEEIEDIESLKTFLKKLMRIVCVRNI